MNAIFQYDFSVITAEGVTASGSDSVAATINQVFDKTHGNGLSRPIDEAYKAKSITTGDNNNYFGNQFTKIYNASISHSANGVSGSTMGGGAAGSVSSALKVAFQRNYTDYEIPDSCFT